MVYRVRIKYREVNRDYYTEAESQPKAISNALYRFHCEYPRYKHLNKDDISVEVLDPSEHESGKPPIPPPTAKPPHEFGKSKPSQGRFGFMDYQDFSDFHDKS